MAPKKFIIYAVEVHSFLRKRFLFLFLFILLYLRKSLLSILK